MEELDKGLKELRGFAAPWWGSNSINQLDTLRAPGDWTTNQRVHIEGPMALATYVAEDGLVGHQWEVQPFSRRVFAPPM